MSLAMVRVHVRVMLIYIVFFKFYFCNLFCGIFFKTLTYLWWLWDCVGFWWLIFGFYSIFYLFRGDVGCVWLYDSY